MPVHCARPSCDVRWPRDPVLEIPCPVCRAPIGVKCRRPSGHPIFGLLDFHARRDIEADRRGKYGRCPSGRCGKNANRKEN
jgi:hypothetical protein